MEGKDKKKPVLSHSSIKIFSEDMVPQHSKGVAEQMAKHNTEKLQKQIGIADAERRHDHIVGTELPSSVTSSLPNKK